MVQIFFGCLVAVFQARSGCYIEIMVLIIKSRKYHKSSHKAKSVHWNIMSISFLHEVLIRTIFRIRPFHQDKRKSPNFLAVLLMRDIFFRIRILGSVPLTKGSGSGRPKNIRILRIWIRIRNTGTFTSFKDKRPGYFEFQRVSKSFKVSGYRITDLCGQVRSLLL